MTDEHAVPDDMPMFMYTKETLTLLDAFHMKDDQDCPQCKFPYPIRCECKGLVHGEYDADGFMLSFCERCGYDTSDSKAKAEMPLRIVTRHKHKRG